MRVFKCSSDSHNIGICNTRLNTGTGDPDVEMFQNKRRLRELPVPFSVTKSNILATHAYTVYAAWSVMCITDNQ
jgi:hypothetical protein